MNATWRAKKFDAVLPIVSQAYSEFAEPSKISIENFVGFVRVPVGLAGPLRATVVAILDWRERTQHGRIFVMQQHKRSS
jgi:hypothetical protein